MSEKKVDEITRITRIFNNQCPLCGSRDREEGRILCKKCFKAQKQEENDHEHQA